MHAWKNRVIRRASFVVISALLVAPNSAKAQLAKEDFDGGAVNLSASSVPSLDGGAGDYFGIGSRNEWPQGTPPGVPFSLGDDSAFDYSNPTDGSLFAEDTEGVFGQNSNFDNRYFAISDSDEFEAEQTASWTFNVSGTDDLMVSIDMGGISNDSFGGYNDEAFLTFTATLDGGVSQTLFDVRATPADPAFTTRPMDAGIASGGGTLLVVSGDQPVTKTLADTGGVANNLYLDKSPAEGAGAGMLDTFSTALIASGNELTITLTANVPFEAAAFDNIAVSAVPEPASVTLLLSALLGLGLFRRN